MSPTYPAPIISVDENTRVTQWFDEGVWPDIEPAYTVTVYRDNDEDCWEEIAGCWS